MAKKLTKEQLLKISKKEALYAILKISRLIKIWGEEFLSDSFKNHDEFMLLDAINDRTGMSQKEIAEKNVIETSRVSKILSMFEKQGLIKKTPAVRNNKLINQLCITKTGKAKIAENEPKINELTKLVSELLSDSEIIDFSDNLTDISEKLEHYVFENLKNTKQKVE